MPQVIAQILRTVIMSLATGAAITVVQEILDGTVKRIVTELSSEEGLSTQEAKDIVVNILVDLALNSVTIAGVLKSKIAVKTAEFLGLTSKGFVKRVLTQKATAAAVKLTGTLGAEKAKSWIPKILKIVAVPGSLVWLTSALANIIEPGIYKPAQTNAIYEKLGIPFQYPITGGELQPGPYDTQQFRDLAKAFEAVSVKGFVNKEFGGFVPYTRENLAKLIDLIYGTEVVKGNILPASKFTALLAPYIMSKDLTVGVFNTPAIKTSPSVASSISVKVFTGVVSQGTVGNGLTFTPRPDDLIEDMNELQQAINNNVAPYLASLLNQVVYEIRVVSSVIVNGVRQTGTTQRIQSGSNANGSPKYKMVTNKFAVADIFLRRDSDTRTKLTSIVLGPVNATSFQPTTNDLINLSAAIPKNILTSNTDDIDTFISATPTLVVAPASAESSISRPSAGYMFVYDGYRGSVSFNTATVDRLRNEIASNTKSIDDAMRELQERHSVGYDAQNNQSQGEDSWANSNPNVVRTAFQVAPDKIRAILTTGGSFAGTPVQEKSQSSTNENTVSSTAAMQQQINAAATLPEGALSANTLYEYYGALGKQLPPLAERGVTYQSLGLGQAVFYTGTSEQNIKLLKALQGKPL